MGSRNQRRLSHSHHDRRRSSARGRGFSKGTLGASRETSDYNHQTYADYAASFRKAKSSGKMAEQPAPEYLQGAAIGLDNASGDILVLVGGRDFEHNQFNRALQARRPAGTAMLPFVYATAFERGMYPGSVVEDSPLDNRAVMIGGTTGILGEWGPENADNHYEGRMTCQAGAREIEKWRNSPNRNGCGSRGGVAALFFGGYSFSASSLSGDISRQQRSYAGRAGDGIHDFSEWRVATEHAAYSGAH
jgi:membrane carboxypeptidase/penicillin-binding protein